MLYQFWEEGIRRSASYENIISLGMRGDGDEAMGGQLTFQEKIEPLQRIVQDQRHIISEQTKREASDVPRLWALYKEVQDYYENGMRVPDDITLLWSDDNHGNLRRVPTTDERGRSEVQVSIITSTMLAVPVPTNGSIPYRLQRFGSKCTKPTNMAQTVFGS